MGELKFHISPNAAPSKLPVDHAYLTGTGRVTCACRAKWENGLFAIYREEKESSCLWIPWEVEGHGQVMLGTTSLLPRDRPFVLALELARGAINRLREQMRKLEQQEYQIGPELCRVLCEIQRLFHRAVRLQANPLESEALAQQALKGTLDLGERLLDDATPMLLSRRRDRTGKLGLILAGVLEEERPQGEGAQKFVEAFTAAVLPVRWRNIEISPGEYDWAPLERKIRWCRQRGLKILLGPLFVPDSHHIPLWVLEKNEDFLAFAGRLQTFLRTVTRRYAEYTSVWHCAAYEPMNDLLDRFEREQIIRLLLMSVETIKGIDARTSTLLSLRRTWGTHIARSEGSLLPIRFADALGRGNLGLSGIGMEMEFDRPERGQYLRDPLDVIEHIGRWGVFGLPLAAFVSIGSSSCDDTSYDIGTKRDVKNNTDLNDTDPPVKKSCPSDAQRIRWARRLLYAIAMKPAVQGIVWQNWQGRACEGASDEMKTHYRDGLLGMLTEFRRTYLEGL